MRLQDMLTGLKREYGYSYEDVFLVLKDIPAKIWQNRPC